MTAGLKFDPALYTAANVASQGRGNLMRRLSLPRPRTHMVQLAIGDYPSHGKVARKDIDPARSDPAVNGKLILDQVVAVSTWCQLPVRQDLPLKDIFRCEPVTRMRAAVADDLRAARSRGEATGLSPEEIAFYDALADNRSAVEVLGNDQLKVIAHELLKTLQANVTVDWSHRDSARARPRVLVKRILRKYGYPPDLQDDAVRGVLAQAEAMLTEMQT